MIDADSLINTLPDPEAARRFLTQLAEKHPSHSKRLAGNDALLSDTATLVSYSPLFATTLLQNPEYIGWLGRKRMDSTVRDKRELLESLARFSLTNSQVEAHVILARFRRRELMRIFLRDIRRLSTVAEITEEISNLADAIVEHALRLSRQELDNRFGAPQELDERGRMRPAGFCIVSMGKLGSKELNYSSDIDLIFIYSSEGTTSGSGSKGATSNLEYFSKLAQSITKLVGGQGGEGAAYRVDMRLRPHGRVGPLALPLADTVRYYRNEAAAWERQVLIRSRSSAGSEAIFRAFHTETEDVVFSGNVSVVASLENVRLSKQKIDLEKRATDGIDIKLGSGGIREIEFIAQAFQLAHGGRDEWLRAPHTLISLTRLSERGHITHTEHTQLFDAYDFLRRLEHILQMENGLQTHAVPVDNERRGLIARRMRFATLRTFDASLKRHTKNVNRIFRRVFANSGNEPSPDSAVSENDRAVGRIEKADSNDGEIPSQVFDALDWVAPRFAAIAKTHPQLLSDIRSDQPFPVKEYVRQLLVAVADASEFGEQLGALRRTWLACLLEIVVFDVLGNLPLTECKIVQTRLAEASIETALWITKRELEKRYQIEIEEFPLAVLGLGKLGGGGMDYDSDLDLVMVYDATAPLSGPRAVANGEFYSKAVEIFTTVLSSITRDGTLYRVDLRLRPHGSDGPLVISKNAFAEYMSSTAAIWELLAFVKLRAVGGDVEFAKSVEEEIRVIIHERALNVDPQELASETRAVRLKLEQKKAGRRRGKDIDIKYGEGGLLDIYFAMRFLQLRDNTPDTSGTPPYEGGVAATSADGVVLSASARSTLHVLLKLRENGSISDETFAVLNEGYEFLTAVDHNMRLTVGRISRVPAANQHALEVNAERMNLASTNEIFDQLALHRLSIREAFDSIVDL